MDKDVQYKKYAVVKFLLDSTFSEIPTAWLINEDVDNQLCWWPPRTFNSATLIANCSSPNVKTWIKYEVDVVKYCTSLESARKSAADANYHTTDEESLGRGKRQHITNSRYSDEEDYDNSQHRRYKRKQSRSNIVLSEVPPCPDSFNVNNNVHTIMQENIRAQKDVLDVQHEKPSRCSNILSEVPFCSDSFSRNNNINNVYNMQEIIHAQNDVAIVQHEKQNDLISMGKENEYVSVHDVPIIVEGCNIVSNNKNAEENSSMKENIQQVVRMQAAIQLSLRDISQRLVKIENAIQVHAVNLPRCNDVLIAQFLPLTSTDRIKEFESLLKTTEEAVQQFKEFLSKTGGNNPKDNIQRSLKKIFTNECAMQCSWKGIRNNFRVVDLYMMKIVRGEITSRNVTLTESEFDNVAAEWLRFAKQRKERDDKANNTRERNDDEMITMEGGD